MTAVTNDFKDGVSFEDQSSDIGSFSLLGGRYLLAATATWNAGSLALQMLMPDGSTYIGITNGSLSADGTLSLDLPAGSYRLAVTSATGAQGSLSRVPFRAS